MFRDHHLGSQILQSLSPHRRSKVQIRLSSLGQSTGIVPPWLWWMTPRHWRNSLPPSSIGSVGTASPFAPYTPSSATITFYSRPSIAASSTSPDFAIETFSRCSTPQRRKPTRNDVAVPPPLAASSGGCAPWPGPQTATLSPLRCQPQ